MSLLPLNEKCFCLLVRACSQVTILSLFPSPLLFKEGFTYKMWPLVMGVSLQLLCSLCLSFCMHQTFFFLFGSYLGNSLLCSNFIWAIRFPGSLHKSWREKEGCNVFTKTFMANKFFSKGGSYPVECIRGHWRYLWQGKQMLGVNLNNWL